MTLLALSNESRYYEYQNITNFNSSRQAEDEMLSCDEVFVERLFSLTLSFFTTLYLCYVITALFAYGKKMKLEYTLWKGMI